jgi:hypothetical protein
LIYQTEVSFEANPFEMPLNDEAPPVGAFSFLGLHRASFLTLLNCVIPETAKGRMNRPFVEKFSIAPE